jgi:transposase
MSAAKNGGARRAWSLEERQRIVAEALARRLRRLRGGMG